MRLVAYTQTFAQALDSFSLVHEEQRKHMNIVLCVRSGPLVGKMFYFILLIVKGCRVRFLHECSSRAVS